MRARSPTACGITPRRVFARVHDGRVLADPRTLLDGDEEILIAAFRAALATEGLAIGD